MSKFFRLYVYICVVGSIFLVTSCDKPKASQEENKDSREATPAAYTFAFIQKEHKQAYTDSGTYPYPVDETNKPTSDKRTFTYTSSNDAIATVNNTGTVTFVTAGTVIITATKNAEGEHEKVTDSYTLYITMKPTSKTALVEEIRTAINAHDNEVDLNYIDTSAITDMSYLFSADDILTRDRVEGYGLSTFNGDISKWDVRKVITMEKMFSDATAFNGNLSEWRVGKVANMKSMFTGATAFNGDISKWDVSAATAVSAMFLGATAFNQDISGWDVSAVTDIDMMFFRASAFRGTNLNCWADRIHATIRSEWNIKASRMFRRSDVKQPPTWYGTRNTTPPAGCTINPKDAEE